MRRQSPAAFGGGLRRDGLSGVRGGPCFVLFFGDGVDLVVEEAAAEARRFLDAGVVVVVTLACLNMCLVITRRIDLDMIV